MSRKIRNVLRAYRFDLLPVAMLAEALKLCREMIVLGRHENLGVEVLGHYGAPVLVKREVAGKGYHEGFMPECQNLARVLE